MTRPTPVYIVCSPRPRTGKTLIARLLVEFLRSNHDLVTAFDLDRNEPSLVHYLPACTSAADIGATVGQIELFDRLVTNDGTPKVVDVGHVVYNTFFAVAAEIGYFVEARRRRIESVVLYTLEREKASVRGFVALQKRLPDVMIVPVTNDFLKIGREPLPAFKVSPLELPRLSPLVSGVIDKTSFSFAGYADKGADNPTEIHDWIRRVFVQFRELELRFLMDKLRKPFSDMAPGGDNGQRETPFSAPRTR